ncbi:partial Serine/threonine-protein kinase PK-1, partial [Gammaproteobacteria bacterium]
MWSHPDVPRPLPRIARSCFTGAGQRLGSATESEVREAGARRLAEGDVLAGKYRIDAVLGEGGMGAVYRALHLATKKRVAIKTMHARYAEDDAWVTRFTREAQAAGRIHHPNVVDVYDV